MMYKNIVSIVVVYIINFIFPIWLHNADFYNEKVVSTIAFGSCSKHDHPQPLWGSILNQNPDLWVWLGDAVYTDTRILPFVWWLPSTIENMKEKYDMQKENHGYKTLLDQNVPVIGIWDDHDYGIDGGGKEFRYRLQAQKMFLDFVDEPIDSVRRQREGIYTSYLYGTGNKIVKIILLDVRSHWVRGSNCDVLGAEQWKWLEQQLSDVSANLTFIGTGKQVLSDIPFIDKWMSCSSSLDRLIFLAQKVSRVVFLSGDVHFSEVNCLNSSGTGYPIYEFTSSGMTHTCSFPPPSSFCTWSLQNVVASRYRISNVVTDKSYGVLKIDWDSTPVQVKFELVGVNSTLSSFPLSLDDLQLRRNPALCPVAIEQPNWYWKRVFWCSVVFGGIIAALLALRITFIIGRWIALELLKDLDTKIKRRIKKLKLLLSNYTYKRNKTKAHND